MSVAELIFFAGTMDSGKSTLALQMNHNHSVRGRRGLLFTCHDRSGRASLSSRLGLQHHAEEVGESLDFWQEIVRRKTQGEAVHFLICDEAQFYTAQQIEQLTQLVDHMGIDVYAFGIITDFRTKLFPGSQRLIELADEVRTLQVEALCWCGKKATHNARVFQGTMVVDGDQMLIGDVSDSAELGYETLCRKHYMRAETSQQAQRIAESDELLPFQL